MFDHSVSKIFFYLRSLIVLTFSIAGVFALHYSITGILSQC